MSDYNNTILVSINDYANRVNEKCIEGKINNEGIILSYSGISVDIEKSYSNMKGIGFKDSLIEYKKNNCLLNKENNYNKYIISGNKIDKKISLVVDIDSLNYYEKMNMVSKKENINLNYLVNYNDIDSINIKNNILYKTNIDNINKFRKKINHFYCVKYNSFEVIDYCKKYRINSLLMKNYISNNLLFNIKKVLDKGEIIYFKENNNNYNELSSAIKYIKSMGYSIVSIDELLS